MATSKTLYAKHWLALLAVLFVIVLIAHLAIIMSARGQYGIKNSVVTETFTTRTIELPAIGPVLDKAPVPAPALQLPTKLAKPKTVHPQTTETVTAPLTTQFANMSETAGLVEPSATPSPEAAPAGSETTLTTPIAMPSGASGDANLSPPAFVALNAGLHTYKVTFTKSGVVNQGDAQIAWRQDSEKYVLNMLATYTLLIKTFNVFEQNSTGLVTPQGLQPLRFSDKRLNRSEVAAHFNYSSGKITFSTNKPEAPLLAGAQDRVSVVWQLAGLLAAQPTQYPPGSMFTVQTVSSSDVEPWLFTVHEPETLNLSSGSQIALRLTRNPRREFDQKIELWFATDLNYLPVRFRYTDTNGDYLDAVWQNVQPWPSVSY
jgi:Protein of unknown function (DUF3108)